MTRRELPWSQIKVGFEVYELDAVWDNKKFDKQLPPGWTASEIYASPCGAFLIFDVTCQLRVKDGLFVKRMIAAFERDYAEAQAQREAEEHDHGQDN